MGELIIGILFLFLSILIFIKTTKLPESNFDPVGPAGFPQIIILIMGILSAILIINKVRELKKGEDIENLIKKLEFPRKIFAKYRSVFITCLTFFICISTMKYIGYIISTSFFLFVTQWLIGPKEKKRLPLIILITAGVTLGSFYFFQNYLSVIFPRGIFFE